MQKFIQLTKAGSRDDVASVHLNPERIEYCHPVSGGGTQIHFAREHFIVVKESYSTVVAALHG